MSLTKAAGTAKDELLCLKGISLTVFLGFGPGKNKNWSDLSLILSEIWSVFGLILAILGPEYKVEALN